MILTKQSDLNSILLVLKIMTPAVDGGNQGFPLQAREKWKYYLARFEM